MPENTSKTCVVLQPGYLPWLGFFEQMCRADVFVYLDDVQFDKHGWRNRNRIKGPAGPQWLTVPVRLSGMNNPRICDVLIDGSRATWAAKHLKTLRMNCASSPFFDWLYPDLEGLLTKQWTNIADLDIALADLLCGKMSLKLDVRRSSTLNLAHGRCERLIEICRTFNCNSYYTGAAARAYLDGRAFERAGISVTFQDYHHPAYPQRYGPFVSHLSVVDLMFNCGPRSLEVITSSRPVGCRTAAEQ